MGIDIRTGVDTQRGTKVRTIGENSKARERERETREMNMKTIERAGCVAENDRILDEVEVRRERAIE